MSPGSGVGVQNLMDANVSLYASTSNGILQWTLHTNTHTIKPGNKVQCCSGMAMV